MRLGLEAEPWLVSPNQHEAEQLVGQELFDDEDFLMALDAIAEMGARNVHITLEDGCFALVREERQVRRYRAVVAAARVRLRGRRRRRPARAVAHLHDRRRREPTKRLRLAAAAGAASVLEVGAGRFDPAEARRLAAAVEVHAARKPVCERPARTPLVAAVSARIGPWLRAIGRLVD